MQYQAIIGGKVAGTFEADSTEAALDIASTKFEARTVRPVEELATFVIISDPNNCAGGNKDFRVHREGCRDIAKHMRHPKFGMAGNSWTRKAINAKAAVTAEADDFRAQDQGFDEKDFHICNCCKK